MSAFWAPEAYAALSADGSAAGYVTVADNTVFYTGAHVILSCDSIQGQRAMIVKIGASGKIYVRFINEGHLQVPTYGYSDVSAYTTAGHAAIFMHGQVVRLNGIGTQVVPAV